MTRTVPARDGLRAPAAVVSPDERRALHRVLDAARRGTAWRAEPITRKIAYARRSGVDLPPDPEPAAVDDALERVMGSLDLLPGHWLQAGHQAGEAVALVQTERGPATGFLVSPWLLLTNQHVLRTADDADGTTLSFRYQRDARGRTGRVREHRLDPVRFFVADEELDYALVALAAGAAEQDPGRGYGSIPLRTPTGKIMLGQPVNIVQHPQGRPREIAVRENRLLAVSDTTLTYTADTEPGASGSPVLNDRWELVALHRRSVEAVDDRGRPVDLDGHPVTRATPDDRRDWVANEGVRVSAIVADLAARSFPPAQAGLLDQVLTEGAHP
jgi:endonuclease G